MVLDSKKIVSSVVAGSDNHFEKGSDNHFQKTVDRNKPVTRKV